MVCYTKLSLDTWMGSLTSSQRTEGLCCEPDIGIIHADTSGATLTADIRGCSTRNTVAAGVEVHCAGTVHALVLRWLRGRDEAVMGRIVVHSRPLRRLLLLAADEMRHSAAVVEGLAARDTAQRREAAVAIIVWRQRGE